jgi:hypothetical protein
MEENREKVRNQKEDTPHLPGPLIQHPTPPPILLL